MGEQVQDLVTF